MVSRISILLLVKRSRNRLRVFLRFAQIDGDVDVAVLRPGDPFAVLPHAVGADIVRIPRELIEIIRCLLRAFLIELCKGPGDDGRSRCEHAHKPCIEKITACDAAVYDTAVHRVIQEILQDRLELASEIIFRSVGRPGGILHPAACRIQVPALFHRLMDFIRSDSKAAVRFKLQRIEKPVRRENCIVRFDEPRLQSVEDKCLYGTLRAVKKSHLNTSLRQNCPNAVLPNAAPGARSPRFRCECLLQPFFRVRYCMKFLRYSSLISRISLIPSIYG